jgi:hypothetical protein
VTSAALPMWISRQLASQLAQGQIRLDFRRNKEKEKKRKNGKENKKQLFDYYFYESKVSDASFTKRIVWHAKNAIFSLKTEVE